MFSIRLPLAGALMLSFAAVFATESEVVEQLQAQRAEVESSIEELFSECVYVQFDSTTLTYYRADDPYVEILSDEDDVITFEYRAPGEPQFQFEGEYYYHQRTGKVIVDNDGTPLIEMESIGRRRGWICGRDFLMEHESFHPPVPADDPRLRGDPPTPGRWHVRLRVGERNGHREAHRYPSPAWPARITVGERAPRIPQVLYFRPWVYLGSVRDVYASLDGEGQHEISSIETTEKGLLIKRLDRALVLRSEVTEGGAVMHRGWGNLERGQSAQYLGEQEFMGFQFPTRIERATRGMEDGRLVLKQMIENIEMSIISEQVLHEKLDEFFTEE